MSRVSVSLEAVKNVKSACRGVADNARTAQSYMSSAIQGNLNICQTKLDAYQLMANTLERLQSAANTKINKANREVSVCRARLNSTPRTIKVTETNSQGQSVTKEKSNPAYGAAQGALNSAMAHLNAVKNVAANIANAKQSVNANMGNLRGFQSNLYTMQNNILPAINSVASNVQTMEDKLGNVEKAINNYIYINI